MENKMAPPPYNHNAMPMPAPAPAYPQQAYPQPQFQQPQFQQPQFQQPNVIITTPIIAVGGCPSCRAGVMQDDFTCCGIFCAIFFFPIGILCCLLMRDKRCSNCGARFD